MKHTAQLLLTLCLIISATAAFSQTEKPDLVTDRPDQTEAPVLVPAGGLQVETGFIYESNKEGVLHQTNLTYNTTLIKYGINEFVELRFITEYLGEKISGESSSSKITGFSPMAFGVKIKLADEKGAWPQAALIGHLNVNTGSREFNADYTSADFRFTFAHTLSEKFALSYNLGVEWSGETPEATFAYTLSLGYNISSKLGVFVESYSFFPEAAKADNRCDAGLTYKITPVVQWDISGGFGLSSNAPDSFVSTGLSFRVFK